MVEYPYKREHTRSTHHLDASTCGSLYKKQWNNFTQISKWGLLKIFLLCKYSV